jgi:hypothetical protein
MPNYALAIGLSGRPGRQTKPGTARRMRVPAMWRLDPLHNTPGLVGEDDRSTTLDSESPRRSTVMCALRWFSSVIHEYQSDSSSKKPVSSAYPDAPGGPAPPRTTKPVDNRSLHISRLLKKQPAASERQIARPAREMSKSDQEMEAH